MEAVLPNLRSGSVRGIRNNNQVFKSYFIKNILVLAGQYWSKILKTRQTLSDIKNQAIFNELLALFTAE